MQLHDQCNPECTYSGLSQLCCVSKPRRLLDVYIVKVLQIYFVTVYMLFEEN